MNKKMPTPETQAAHDAAYEIGLRGEDLPKQKQADTKEEAMLRLAEIGGYAAGINEHYKRKGIRTEFCND